MKHALLFAGIAVIGYTMWQKRQGSGVVGTDGLTPSTGIAVSPATLVVPGANGGSNTSNQVSGLGGDANITAVPQTDSPSAVSHSIMREDYGTMSFALPAQERDSYSA